MAKVFYLNVVQGKEEYSKADVKSLDDNTFKKVLGTPQHQKQMGVVVLDAENVKKLQKGEKLKKVDLGEATQSEVKTLSSKNELLKSENEEQKSEIEKLQAKIKELEAQSLEAQSKAPASEPTEATKTTKKTAAKK
ncbi:hypothetical protein [Bernardetia sp.]|uniref:hypothetical protein n=1 Tax=Bernardetia sp. TaxID=1937974 RepID=UPI0025B8A501|nr:hypothetical protein [Bernardetia sp.]